MNNQEILDLAKFYENKLPELNLEIKLPTGNEIAGWIDHTLLKPNATSTDINRLCAEATEYEFATVCVNPIYVAQCSKLLHGMKSKVCSVIGFPLGASTTNIKVQETKQAIEDGASEIDMVIDIGALKSGDYKKVLEEIIVINQALHSNASLKVIVENCFLDRKEKIISSILCKQAQVSFIKTSTGFGPSGATVEDVELMRRIVGADIGVKAAGGIRTYADAMAMIRAGATRIGASASVAILLEATD